MGRRLKKEVLAELLGKRVSIHFKWDEFNDGTDLDKYPVEVRFDIKKKSLEECKKNLKLSTGEIKERAALIGLCGSKLGNLKNSIGSGSYYESTSSSLIADLVLLPLTSTFKLCGMDINEDLDAVVKGARCHIKFGNLLTDFFYFINARYDNSSKKDLVAKISEDAVKSFLENIKLGKFEVADFGDPNFFSSFLNGGGPQQVYRSVVVNFFRESGISSPDTANNVEALFQEEMLRFLRAFTGGYIKLKNLMEFLDEYFTFLSAIKPREKVLEGIRNSLDETHLMSLIGDFRGFCKGGHIGGDSDSLHLWNGLWDACAEGVINKTPIDANYPIDKSLAMTGMYELRGSSGILADDPKELVALSLADFMMFRDDDMSLVGFDTEEDKDLIFENISVACRQPFRDFVTPEMEELVSTVILGPDPTLPDVPGLETVYIDQIEADTELPDEAPKFAVMLRDLLRSRRLTLDITKKILELFETK